MHETPRKQPNKLPRALAAVTFAAGSLAMVGAQREASSPHALSNQQEADYRTADGLKPFNLAPFFRRAQASKQQDIVGEPTEAPPPPPPPPTTTTTTEAPTTTTTTTSPPVPAESTSNSAPSGAWYDVAICEEGGKNDSNAGYLGFKINTWDAYGGDTFASSPGGANWDEQVEIAYRIQSAPPTWPGEPGCANYHGW